MIETIHQHSTSLNIERACELFEVSRSSYYERINRKESKRAKENRELNDRILKIYEDSGRRYGAPKIHQ